MSKTNGKEKALMPISDKLRKAIEDSGLTRYRIAKEAGCHQGILTRFLNENRFLSMETADRIAEVLGMELVQKSKPKVTTTTVKKRGKRDKQERLT